MKQICRRLLALVLALAMSLSLCAAPAWAAAKTGTGANALNVQSALYGTCGERANWEMDSEGGTLILSGSGRVDAHNFRDAFGTPFTLWDKVTAIIAEEGITGFTMDYKFPNCTDLTVPGSLGEIEAGAFEGPEDAEDEALGMRSSLQRVTIKDGVTKIGEGAFYYCAQLQHVDIPDTVTAIGSTAFSRCSELTQLRLPAKLEYVSWRLCMGCSKLSSVNIPDSVSEIEFGAFSDCKSLSSITVPGGVATIGEGAFEGCASLSSVTLKSGIKTLEDGVFLKCARLDSITIPDSVTAIGQYAVGYWDESTKMPDFVIRGYTGSAAETYARANGIPFQSIGTLDTFSPTALKSAKAKKGRKIEVKWNRNKTGKGYELQYSTDRKFKKDVKKVTISSSAITSKTVKNLKAGKSYYFRIRTVRGSKKSIWSNVKTAKAKK